MLLLAVASSASAADLRLRGETEAGTTRKRLVEAQQQLASGKVAEAVAELQRIIDESGGDLVMVNEERFLAARVVAHRSIVALPADALTTYRDRVETAAKKLYDAGNRERDPAVLQTLLARYFASRPAEPALLLLGELAFERGDFTTATSYWKRLLPAGVDGPELVYPRPQIDPAQVKAKIVLAAIFAGDVDASSQFKAFKLEHPKATGRLAGKDGVLAQTLLEYQAKPPRLAREAGSSAWPTYAGNFGRSGHGTDTLPFSWPSRPTWRTSIRADDRTAAGVPPTNILPARSLIFHPVVLGGRAYISDAGYLHGFDLQTGAKSTARLLLPGEPPFPELPGTKRGDAAESASTLTVGGRKLFARVERVKAVEKEGDKSISYLAAFPPLAVGAAPKLLLRAEWAVKPPTADGESGSWEGAPVYADGRLYAAFERQDDRGRVAIAVACYDDPPGQKPVWVSTLCDADGNQSTSKSHHHHVLTLAGENLVLATHAGLTIAVNRVTGKSSWAHRNASVTVTTKSDPKDPSPAVDDRGRVFVAPADAERIYALDGTDGRVLWQSPRLKVERILGVSGTRLIATVASPHKGVRALDTATGTDLAPEGWRNHDDPDLGDYGRGIVADGRILWPTREKLYALRADDGTVARQPLPGPHGNLAYADGVLVVATAIEVFAYVISPSTEPNPSAQEQIETLQGTLDRDRARGRLSDVQQHLHDVMTSSTLPRAVRAVATADRWSLLDSQSRGSNPIPDELLAEWILDRAGKPTRLGDLLTPPPQTPVAQDALPKPPAVNLFDRDAVAAPAIASPVEVGRIVHFPTAAWPLLPFNNGRELPGLDRTVPAARRLLFVSDGRSILAYRPESERPAWSKPLPFPATLTHGSYLVGQGTGDDVFLAAGPRAIVAIKPADGSTIWSFQLPPQLQDMDSPHVAGPRLILRVGNTGLLAIHHRRGTVDWALSANGKRGLAPYAIESAPSLARHFAADHEHVLVQRSDGRRWTVSAIDGTRLEEAEAPLTEWQTPPLPTDARGWIIADGPGSVSQISCQPARTTWTRHAPGEASLTGRLPSYRVLGENRFLVAISRNFGVELDSYRLATGENVRKKWSRLLPVAEVDPAAADSSPDLLLVPAEGRLFAIRTSDARSGEMAWTTPLPDSANIRAWNVRVGRTQAIAYPTVPFCEEPVADAAARMTARFLVLPTAERFFRITLALAAVATERTLPVLMLEIASGRILQRVDVPVFGPMVFVHLHADTAAVVSLGKVAWLRSAR